MSSRARRLPYPTGTMDTLILRLALALAIGLLVGLERGWREREAPDRSRTAGIRTYGLSGLLGGLFAALAQAFGSSAILVAGLLTYSAIFTWFKTREAIHDHDFSVTSVVAAIAVFALGALAVAGDQLAAAAGGAALAAVLASRQFLHSMLRRLSWVELRSALILAVMSAVVLPLLPNHTIDPWGGLNPWQIWFFTVLTAAISFVGYVAVRLLGEARGLLVSSLASAVVSSTAVTVALARTAKSGGNVLPLAGAASLAAMVSILRVCVVVLIVAPGVAAIVAAPALAAALCFALGGAFLLFRKGGGGQPAGEARNPFEILPLLVFAILFGAVSMASAALVARVGQSGLIVTSALSGTFDVDVAVLSALRLVGEVIQPQTAGLAVLGALAANALGRLTLAVVAGPIRFSLPLGTIALAAAGAGYAVLRLTAA